MGLLYKKLNHFIIVSISYIAFVTPAMALIKFEDAVFPELATSARALAMGNAYISKVDDSSSVFYNPAGLGTVRWGHFHLTNIHLETNRGLLSSSSGGSMLRNSGNITKGFSLEGARQLLLENRGKLVHNRVHTMPNITARYISLGYLLALQNRATMGQETDALYEYASRRDHGPFLGLNVSLFGGIIKLGASAIHLNRKEVIGESDRDTPLNLQDSDYKVGSAMIYTGGAKLTIPIIWLPTFSATFHNMAQNKFTINSAGAPDQIRHSIDVGFSLTPQIGKTTRVHLEIDYKDLNKKFPEVSTTRKVLAGLELDFLRFIFVRLGYGDGFGSAGIGLRAKKLEFDLTTYALDTTSSEFRGKEDRRFVLSLSSGF